MIRYHASWVLPIAAPPIRDGWIDVDHVGGGRIVAVGGAPGRGVPGAGTLPGEGAVHDLGSVAILPGLVNAHTHLELSYLRNRVPPASDFLTWIRAVVGARRTQPDPKAPEILRSVDEGISEAVRCGTALVGDISNTLVTVEPLARSALGGVVFHELIKFNAPDPRGFVESACQLLDALPTFDGVRTSLAAHAPYSVSPRVFEAIRRAVDARGSVPSSVHLSESRDESEFIASGGGAWRMFLEQIGAWDPAWTAPGTSPVAYLDGCGFLDSRMLAVHGVQMSSTDLACLASRGATLVSCPRSNRYTGAGDPPISEFFASGVRVAVGTDSLASAPDLNLFAELAAMHALAPDVSPRQLLESATRQGARALGFEADYGSLEPGKAGRFLAVSIPEGLTSVEEYLVSGVRPDQIRWLGESSPQ